jgi:hypothetical protein
MRFTWISTWSSPGAGVSTSWNSMIAGFTITDWIIDLSSLEEYRFFTPSGELRVWEFTTVKWFSENVT